jgi:hypothetical protein
MAKGNPMALTFNPADPHRSDTEYELTLLSHYWGISQAAVKASERAAKADFDAAFAKSENDDARQFYAHQFLSHARRYREELPLRVSYGFVLQLYAILETRSRALCYEMADRKKNLPVTLDELSGGRHMQGVFTFLKKLLKVPIAQEAALNDLRIIRNCIAHWNGRVAECDNAKQVAGAIRQSKGSKVDGEGYVNLTAAYCENTLQLVKEFFDGVFTELRFAGGDIKFSRPAGRHGVSVEHRDGKWICDVIEEAEVQKLLRTKL